MSPSANVVNIYTMEYYSAIKKTKRMPFAATWIDLVFVILSEVSQTQRDKISYCLYVESKKKGVQMNLLTKEK